MLKTSQETLLKHLLYSPWIIAIENTKCHITLLAAASRSDVCDNCVFVASKSLMLTYCSITIMTFAAVYKTTGFFYWRYEARNDSLV